MKYGYNRLKKIPALEDKYVCSNYTLQRRKYSIGDHEEMGTTTVTVSALMTEGTVNTVSVCASAFVHLTNSDPTLSHTHTQSPCT